MDLHLRVMTPDDIPAGMRLKELANWNQNRGDWERFLAASPEGCFVAEADGRVVGTVATIIFEKRFAWVSMALVDPVMRGQGIGTKLLEQSIAHLDGCHIASMKLDATPQGKPIYEKLGFKSEYGIERWMLKRPDASGSVARAEAPELEEALTLDREVFGADRSGLLRSMAREAPEFVFQTRSGGELTGYAFGRRGSRADQLGPWMARNEASAREILDEFLRRASQKLIFVDVMCDNPWGLPLLRARGFEHSRPFTRMFRGRNDFPGRPDIQVAIMGPEFG